MDQDVQDTATSPDPVGFARDQETVDQPQDRDGAETPQEPAGAAERPADNPLSAYGPARSSVEGAPLGTEELARVDAFWRACNYLALGYRQPAGIGATFEHKPVATHTTAHCYCCGL